MPIHAQTGFEMVDFFFDKEKGEWDVRIAEHFKTVAGRTVFFQLKAEIVSPINFKGIQHIPDQPFSFPPQLVV